MLNTDSDDKKNKSALRFAVSALILNCTFWNEIKTIWLDQLIFLVYQQFLFLILPQNHSVFRHNFQQKANKPASALSAGIILLIHDDAQDKTPSLAIAFSGSISCRL